MMKFAFALVLASGVATAALADKSSELNPLPRHLPTKERAARQDAGSTSTAGNLTNHGGPTLTSAHVVAIFWGPGWSGADSGTASTVTSYIANFGTTAEYNVITQYSGIRTTSLASDNPAAWYDASTPPTNVTDAAIQGEVAKYISAYGFDSSAIYEVFLPAASYSSDGTSTSCGGTNLAYCAYHSNYTSGTNNVKYASMPYPSCGGCQSAGFSDVQNIEHFVSHETREAVTDADGNAWYDRRGNEADDKCAWSPAPFIDTATGYAYQYEWSNANSACVKTR